MLGNLSNSKPEREPLKTLLRKRQIAGLYKHLIWGYSKIGIFSAMIIDSKCTRSSKNSSGNIRNDDFKAVPRSNHHHVAVIDPNLTLK